MKIREKMGLGDANKQHLSAIAKLKIKDAHPFGHHTHFAQLHADVQA